MMGWVSLFLACALLFNVMVGDDGLVDSLRARREHQRLVGELKRLRIDNERLSERARRLRDDPRVLDEVARRELGLIAPGELVLIFNDTPRRAR